ncbi:hypothetical protein CYMTET_32145 [Cymbomonas tetramitiformis]|uniref:Uncharacterized protein n=1 Tax=Cymbomonas tetramitiformis TaxID=36881 RepID=A0AAE0FFV9_9CHLO|nr:hypothetical protein CYMTET_32145 [Cymbomonas tetramitiformis]
MSVTCEILRRRTPTGSDNNLTDALKVIFEKATRLCRDVRQAEALHHGCPCSLPGHLQDRRQEVPLVHHDLHRGEKTLLTTLTC